MAVMVDRAKWIWYKHICDFELVKAVALDVKNNCSADISKEGRIKMQDRLSALNLYKTRNPQEKPLDSINHRINTLEYWMFGYEQKIGSKKSFIFSPLGNLLIKYISDEKKVQYIFLTMLFAMQFQHPASGTNKKFKLFPFRLIFKLLLDERLEGKIYNFEMEYMVVFIESMSSSKYENLVQEMLSLRHKQNIEIAKLFKNDEHTFVNTVHEWEYFTQKLLSMAKIVNYTKGDIICKLYHPSKTNSKSKPTSRSATRGFISLNEDLKEYTKKLLSNYSFEQIPLNLSDEERLKIDVIKEIYGFYPNILLEEINEIKDLFNSKLLELPQQIEKYSNNPENSTAYLFEDVLIEGFNMFYNVEAMGIGGAGNTDIECLYLDKKKKFAVESKSTSNKLLGISVGRLRQHREQIGGAYTIIITPRYVPAAKNDIVGTPNVIILASTFAEFLYNHIVNDIRDIDYEKFDNIIVNNLGTDISKLISNQTIERFGTQS